MTWNLLAVDQVLQYLGYCYHGGKGEESNQSGCLQGHTIAPYVEKPGNESAQLKTSMSVFHLHTLLVLRSNCVYLRLLSIPISKAALLAEHLHEFRFFIGAGADTIKVKNLRSFDVIESWLRKVLFATHFTRWSFGGKI